MKQSTVLGNKIIAEPVDQNPYTLKGGCTSDQDIGPAVKLVWLLCFI